MNRYQLARKTCIIMREKPTTASLFSFFGGFMPRESKFQSDLIKKLENLFPGCIILKNDANLRQGIPDLTILYGRYWATLETKRGARASRQPNQEYYVEKLDEMSYAAFVHPGNEEEVLRDLQLAFNTSGSARIS